MGSIGVRRGMAALLLAASLALSAAPALAAEFTVVLDKMKFGELPESVKPGDTIVWRNDDIFRHTATARDKSFDVDLPAHSEARMIVGAPGTVEFFCRFHPGMTGKLVIAP